MRCGNPLSKFEQQVNKMTNPLLSNHRMPTFNSIDTACMEPAITQIIAENKQVLESLVSEPNEDPTWESLIQVLDNMEDRLLNAWSVIEHLFGVNNSEELREVYQR